MIPTLIVAGLVVGFLPRPWLFAGIVIAAAAWPLLLAISRPARSFDVASALGEFALAALNVAIAAFLMRMFFQLAQTFRQ
jgi:hypothetical protein